MSNSYINSSCTMQQFSVVLHHHTRCLWLSPHTSMSIPYQSITISTVLRNATVNLPCNATVNLSLHTGDYQLDILQRTLPPLEFITQFLAAILFKQVREDTSLTKSNIFFQEGGFKVPFNSCYRNNLCLLITGLDNCILHSL